MQKPRTPALAMLVLLVGGLAACGRSDGSTAAQAPHDASRSSFCGSLSTLTGTVPPARAARILGRVGTPSDIGADARHGFEVLLAHLRDLPPGATTGAINHMAGRLTGTDQQDVAAFVTYYAGECRGRHPTAPAS